MPLHLLQGSLGLLRQGEDPPLALLQPQDAHIGALPLLRVGADGFSELRLVAHDVQHVVPDLEGKPQLLGVGAGGLPHLRRRVGGGAAHDAGRPDHAAGLQPVDLRQLRLGGGMVQGIQHLTRYHAVWAGGLRQQQGAGQPLPGPRHSLQDQLIGRRLQGVSRQHRQGLAVDLVVGGLAPAKVVVVHAGQVVVDQGVGVDHLHRAGGGHGVIPVKSLFPRQAGKFQGQHRPQPLAAGEKAVAHGLVKVRPVGLLREKSAQIVLDSLQVLLIAGVKPSLVHSLLLRFKGQLHRGAVGALHELDHLLLRPVQFPGALPHQLGPLLKEGQGIRQRGVPLLQGGDDLLQPLEPGLKAPFFRHASAPFRRAAPHGP